MLARTTSKDLPLSVAVTVLGGAALLVALRMRWNPGDLSPGIEGAITTTVTGFVMVMLHGVDYPRNVAINVPMIVMLYLACALTTTPAVGVGMVGAQLVLMGFVGLALALREPRSQPITGRPQRPDRQPALTSI